MTRKNSIPKWTMILLLLANFIGAVEFAKARHLLNRTSFMATPYELDLLRSMTYPQAVDYILDSMREEAFSSPPEWAEETSQNFLQQRFLEEFMSPQQVKQYRRKSRRMMRQEGIDLKDWWLQEMVVTPSPFTEKMTLFWHNHFTSGLRKVRSPYLMYQQNVLLRKHASGNFRTLLHAISKNAAMIFYLDNQTNRKGKPNENFARELMELFTLGEGNYGEKEIKEAARAFTGWKANRQTGQFTFIRYQHDDGIKEFMGQRGNFNGEDIVEILLKHPRTAEFICEKLWREFVSPEIKPRAIEELARVFRRHNYEIKPLLRALFLRKEFQSSDNYGTLIKSPVELVVGTIRQFSIEIKNPKQLINYCRQLGQDLLDPPNVKGWPGGTTWINSNTLLARQQFIQRGLRGMDPYIARFWLWPYLEHLKTHPEHKAMISDSIAEWSQLSTDKRWHHIQKVLLAIEPVHPIADDLSVAEKIRELVVDPTYQLK